MVLRGGELSFILAGLFFGQYLAQARAAAQRWTFEINSGSSVRLTDVIGSDAVAAYRAVPLSAP